MKTFSDDAMGKALTLVEATLFNCVNMQSKFPEGSAQHTLLKNRILALSLSKALMTGTEWDGPITMQALQNAAKPIASIVRKCQTGQVKHSVESIPYRRLQNLIDAMVICQAYIQEAITSQETGNT